MRNIFEASRRWLIRTIHAAIGLVACSCVFTPPKPVSLRRVLVSGYTGLGNFILKSVLIRKIQELYPGCEVNVIAGNSFGAEHVLNKLTSLILPQQSNVFRTLLFFWKLRRMRFDAAFLAVDAAPKFLIRGCVLAGIPIRVGHDVEGVSLPSYYYTVRVPMRQAGPRNEIDLNLDLLEAVYGGRFKRDYQPAVDFDSCPSVLKLYGLTPNRYVCVQIGAANGRPTPKRWPGDHFRAVIERLLKVYPDLGIVILGDNGDVPIVHKALLKLVARPLINLAGKVTLEEAKNLIASCKFILCNDSGLLHLANALGTQAIALYGPTDADEYMLKLPTCHVLQAACDCGPPLRFLPGLYEETEAARAARCPGPRCMQRLTVDRVYAKCTELLGQA